MMTKILGTLIAVLLAILIAGWFYISFIVAEKEDLTKSINNCKIELATMRNTISTQSKLCDQRVNIAKMKNHALEDIEEGFKDKKSFKFTASNKSEVLEEDNNLSRISPSNTQCLYDGSGWIWIETKELK